MNINYARGTVPELGIYLTLAVLGVGKTFNHLWIYVTHRGGINGQISGPQKWKQSSTRNFSLTQNHQRINPQEKDEGRVPKILKMESRWGSANSVEKGRASSGEVLPKEEQRSKTLARLQISYDLKPADLSHLCFRVSHTLVSQNNQTSW